MGLKTGTYKPTANRVVRDICRKTRKSHSTEEKIRIVLEGLRGNDGIAELNRRQGIAQSLYCLWLKDFLEAGQGVWPEARRQTTGTEVKELCAEASALKEKATDFTLENICSKMHARDGRGYE